MIFFLRIFSAHGSTDEKLSRGFLHVASWVKLNKCYLKIFVIVVLHNKTKSYLIKVDW